MKRPILTVPIRQINGGARSSGQDLVAVEEPLQIMLGGRNVAITMRTPGDDRELAAGFLFTEGILKRADQIAEIRAGLRNQLLVSLARGAEIDFERLERHFYVSSSCGVCGKASIAAVEATGITSPPRERPQIDAAMIHQLPETLREKQAVFERTGGLHAAALFDSSGVFIDAREDVGRHNAVDKLIGAALLEGALPLSDRVLMVSGRAGFELVQKALMAGIAVMAAVGAPSSLAVELALRYGMTLLGFVRERRFNVYSGEWRVRNGPSA